MFRVLYLFIWDENENTILKMKDVKQNLDGSGNGIIETQKKLGKIECVVIGNQQKWIRKCPECDCDIIVGDRYYCIEANRDRRLCRKCRCKGNRNPNYGNPVSPERKEKQRLTLAKKSPSEYYWYGKTPSEEHRKNIAKTKCGRRLTKRHIDIIRKTNAGNA